MVLETLSLVLPWNWAGSHGIGASSGEKLRQKRHVRSRAQQMAANGDVAARQDRYKDEGYYPGIVNISGTYCFMDSTLQAMASLSYLQPHIEEIHSRAEGLDVPTPVVDALRDILHTLNTPSSNPHALRPIEIINALVEHSKGKHNPLFSSREHQDAQELFQLLSEAIKSEAAAVDQEGQKDRGLSGLALREGKSGRELSKGVFDGLTANRRSCMQCGYTEAVMHFAFDSWQLSVPRQQGSCRLEECLQDYTRLELLTDCICRKCSMLATRKRLAEEADKLTEATAADQDPTISKKRRAREARKLATRVKEALDEGRIEEDIKGVKMDKVFSQASTKQAMVARPPPVLALHLNRSMHFGHYAAKNNCPVIFPEVLDLTPFTTSGKLSTTPNLPISAPPPPLPLTRSTTPTPATYANPRTLYRLSAVVCHYGQHSFGHYVCYRRKPRPPSVGETQRWAPPRFICPLGCECEKCIVYGQIRDEDEAGNPITVPTPGKGWLRISDDSVRECGWESVIQETSSAFMLYYERVQQRDVYGSSSPRASEETLKPIHHQESNGAAIVGQDESIEKSSRELELSNSPPRVFGPRVIRSVSTQRTRSPIAPFATPERTVSSSPTFVEKPVESRSEEDSLINGDASISSHPSTTDRVSLSSPTPTDTIPKQTVESRPAADAPLGNQVEGSGSDHSSLRSSPRQDTASHIDLKAPQPIHASSPAVRTIGLQA